jgi:hypothetical protein
VNAQAAELGNFAMHLKTSQLRSSDSKTRAIPRGFGFDLVSFPNYLFEMLGWVAFSVMTGEWAGTFALWRRRGITELDSRGVHHYLVADHDHLGKAKVRPPHSVQSQL